MLPEVFDWIKNASAANNATNVAEAAPVQIVRPAAQIPFRLPYNRSLLDSYPQRSIWEIPDSSIVFSSNFCSGNMTRASKGILKNSFDIWVAGDAAPHLPD